MEDLVAIVSVVVILPAIIGLVIASVQKAKYQSMGTRAGGGLRASELQRLIRQAVEDAIAPLQERLDALDRPPEAKQHGSRDLPREAPRLDAAALADALDDPEHDTDVAATRRRTRS